MIGSPFLTAPIRAVLGARSLRRKLLATIRARLWYRLDPLPSFLGSLSNLAWFGRIGDTDVVVLDVLLPCLEDEIPNGVVGLVVVDVVDVEYPCRTVWSFSVD